MNTTKKLQEQDSRAKAWEAACSNCGATCRQHSMRGVLEFNAQGYGYWAGCRCSPPGHTMIWREVVC